MSSMADTVQANPDEIIGEDEDRQMLEFDNSVYEDKEEEKQNEDPIVEPKKETTAAAALAVVPVLIPVPVVPIDIADVGLTRPSVSLPPVVSL